MNKQMNRPIRVLGVTLGVNAVLCLGTQIPWVNVIENTWILQGKRIDPDKETGPELAQQECQGMKSEH